MPADPGTSLLRLAVVIACVAGCDDDVECSGAGAVMCEEQTGPIEVSYCEADGQRSECTRVVECNPLTQTGCGDGLACFAVTSWTVCAPEISFPCPPGQQWEHGIEGHGCQDHCVHDGRDGPLEEPVDCDQGEICHHFEQLPDGVGTCVDIVAD